MRNSYKILFASILIVLTSCGSIFFVSKEESKTYIKQETNDKSESQLKIIDKPNCQECLVVPRSGNNRDLRRGYYFDQEKGKCVEFSYSTGPNCIPPPFKTLNECLNCCE
jgi:hypothetical protein